MRQLLVVLAYAMLPVLAAQTPSFEVASVKVTKDDPISAKMPFLPASAQENMRFQGGPGTKDPGRIDYKGVTLKMLLKRAYGVLPDQISGPGWLDTERYDVSAKLPPDATPEQLKLMLQDLLTERFQIGMHREPKTIAVYHLTVAKNGPKLLPPEKPKEYADDQERKADMQKRMAEMRQRMQSRGFTAYNSFHLPDATLGKFAETLSARLEIPVVDRTQLEGSYSFDLEWVPDGAKPRDDGSIGPSVYAAVEEQLGLKLQRANEQVELLVIDKAEKLPISN
jgi:uncharacterized protein (TIGR03435 family)